MLKSFVLVFTASSVWFGLTLAAPVFQRTGAVPAPAPRPAPSVGSLAQQAEVLAAQGAYEGAWGLYYQALEATPEDVSLWYALGVTLSHLNQRKETEQAFQYVVRHGSPNSEEVRLARRWLVSAGVLGERVAFTVAADPVVDARGDKTAVKGKVTWGAPESNRPPLKANIVLEGLNGSAQDKRFSTRVTVGQSYRFERLPAGSYRVIGGAAGHRLWDLTLTVEDGRGVVLDLGKDNSNSPDVALYL